MQQIQKAIKKSLEILVNDNKFDKDSLTINIHLEKTKNPAHGDFATNMALQLAKILKANPRQIADTLTEQLNTLKDEYNIENIEVAGPGFINFKLSGNRYNELLQKIILEKDLFGKSKENSKKKILLEFVSANPTGPLHVGHGRGAAFGATLANILQANGNKVDKEYYVNDAGRQMDILTISVYLRYLEICGQEINYPINAYQADYVTDCAKEINSKYQQKYICDKDLFSNLSIKNYTEFKQNKLNLDKQMETELSKSEKDNSKINLLKEQVAETKNQAELYIDEVISLTKSNLKDDYSIFANAILKMVKDDIKDDLLEFGVSFENWFSEKSLYLDDKIEKAVQVIKAKGWTFEKEGALWFKSTEFGDEKDRVLRRSNGDWTYFASDMGYHNDKYERGYDEIIDIFGADHHGYMARIKSSMQALGHDSDKLKIMLIQFAVLYKDGEKMQMSTRSGKYVTLRNLRKMVGNSAARFFYVAKKPSQHMDFDLDLAVKNNKDNPLFYIQYAHARICRLFERLEEQGVSSDFLETDFTKGELSLDKETTLLRLLDNYSQVIKNSADNYAAHYLINYLRDLASALHSYYDSGQVKFLEENEQQKLRIALLSATKQVLKNGLSLSGVTAPEKM